MKFGLTLKDIKVGDKANIGEVSINVQYTAEELVTEYALFKQILKELPEIVTDLGQAATTFEEVDGAFNKFNETNFNKEATEEARSGALNIVKSALKRIKSDYENKAV